MTDMIPIAAIVSSYLLGSMPFGLLIARWWRGIDVREHGSGNVGATNVYRVVGKPAGVLVFALDVLKGFLPPFVALRLGMPVGWQVAAGFAAIIGHNFSVFLGFQGGKGVATSLGVLFGIAWQVGLIGWLVWTVVVVVTGYVSLGSIAAAVSLAPLTLIFYPGDRVRLGFVIAAAVFSLWKHRANIRRLIEGSESNLRRPGPPDPSTDQAADDSAGDAEETDRQEDESAS